MTNRAKLRPTTSLVVFESPFFTGFEHPSIVTSAYNSIRGRLDEHWNMPLILTMKTAQASQALKHIEPWQQRETGKSSTPHPTIYQPS
jgi:hypothetical protein